MDESPYDFVEFSILDEVIRARPVKWDAEITDPAGLDETGRQVVATEFEGSCPFCSNLIVIPASRTQVKCESCGKGEDQDRAVVSDDPFCSPGEYDKVLI